MGIRPEIMQSKVHKICVDGCLPFKPILSALQTPTYKLPKYLMPILEPLGHFNLIFCLV